MLADPEARFRLEYYVSSRREAVRPYSVELRVRT